jgi:hypothetical protein
MKRSRSSPDKPLNAAQQSRLARIRRLWAALGNPKFKGEPHEELECYFNSLVFSTKGRIEDIVKRQPAVKISAGAELKLIKKELDLCAQIAQYFFRQEEMLRRCG